MQPKIDINGVLHPLNSVSWFGKDLQVVSIGIENSFRVIFRISKYEAANLYDLEDHNTIISADLKKLVKWSGSDEALRAYVKVKSEWVPLDSVSWYDSEIVHATIYIDGVFRTVFSTPYKNEENLLDGLTDDVLYTDFNNSIEWRAQL